MVTQILTPTDENIEKCAYLLKCGELVAFPTETVYGLGSDGLNENAVPKIFIAKGRPQTNPITLHVCDLAQIESVAEVSDKARILINKFMPGPITIILKKKDIVPAVTVAGGDTVGVRMPDNEIALKLIHAAGVPLAATSANSSARPSPTEASHVMDDLEGKIKYIIDGGKCSLGLESTVIDLSDGNVKMLRSGFISEEDVELALSETVADRSEADKSKIPEGYVPSLNLIYAASDSDALREKYSEIKGPGVKVLALEKPSYVQDENYISAGRDTEEYGKYLFELIRGAEKNGTGTLIAVGAANTGIGKAVNSRLIKLSMGNII